METILRRYTDLPGLIYLLSNRRLTLLDPASWDDKNDSRYLELYREKKKLTSVLAVCFTQASETYHHWRIFAGGSSGVCISFRREDLLRAVLRTSDLQAQPVKYLTLKAIGKKRLAVKDLPFRKRYAFGNEDEFRLLWESDVDERSALDIPVPLRCIDRLTLSPWMHEALADDLKAVLRSIKGCGAIKIVRSTLISNDQWQRFGDAAR